MQHHAYVYEGLRTLYPQLVADARVRFKVTEPDDPNIYASVWDTLGIEEVRTIADRALLKSTTGTSLFILAASLITTQAQQALLKLAEEPPLGMVLVLLIPPGILLPALRSRFIQYPSVFTEDADEAGAELLRLPAGERSKMIATLLSEEEGVRDRVRHLLDALEQTLYPLASARADVREGLAAITLVRSYLSDHSASLKLLLEHLAITLPSL